MSKDEPENAFPWEPIPDLFRNIDGQLMDRCVVCGQYLLDDGTQYVIERAFRRSEVIFEYAMCLDCHDQIRKELSVESVRRIEHYFGEHCDFEQRNRQLLEARRTKGYQESDWLEHCLIKQTPVSECEEYQIYAQCDGKDMLLAYMPYAISGAAIDDVLALLSPQTLGAIDDFTGKYLGLPSGADLPRSLLI